MRGKKRLALLIAGLALVVSASVYLLTNQSDNDNTAQNNSIDDVTAAFTEQNKKILEESIPNSDVVSLISLYEDKNYSEAAEVGSRLCANVEDSLKQACYSTYVKALEQLNELERVKTTIEEVRSATFYVDLDSGFKADWDFKFDTVASGQNPKDKTRMSEEEARR